MHFLTLVETRATPEEQREIIKELLVSVFEIGHAETRVVQDGRALLQRRA